MCLLPFLIAYMTPYPYGLVVASCLSMIGIKEYQKSMQDLIYLPESDTHTTSKVSFIDIVNPVIVCLCSIFEAALQERYDLCSIVLGVVIAQGVSFKLKYPLLETKRFFR